MNKESKPIGIFDSGIGGLTVLKEIYKQLPQEGTVYLGDTARVPYGIRSPETVTRYSFENTRFLFSKEVKMIVVACNTASSVSLAAIRSSVSVPVVGVIEPGAKAAVAATNNKKIGIIGTEATIRSNSYAKAIKDIDNSIDVFGVACPLFVPLVEEGWTDGKIAEMTAEKYLQEIKHHDIDTLVLGCTHYPLLKGILSHVMGGNVNLIDSAIETAREIKTVLQNLSLLNPSGESIVREFYVTDSPEKFKTFGERFLGETIDYIKKIKLEMEV
ncbi:MAG: glutamate racemase [Nitrospiraceae bacterium]|nr:MAG: glutamate racemase [Nitrospiraceae bacterium]